MLDRWMWLVSAASLVGTVANVYKRRWCFWVWCVTNTVWVAYDLHKGADAQAALMACYAVLAVMGLLKWKEAE